MSTEREDFADLAGLFQALTAKLDDVHVELRGELTEFRRGAKRFATVDGAGAELRLHPEVAEAARRTPSTVVSPRGPEWIRFEPPHLDHHALDRAEAWFLSAWRAAAARD
jgi:hypothetical protein